MGTLLITTTLSTTEVNEIDGDQYGTVKFSFDQLVDLTTANDYITVYAQLVDGSLVAIPITAIFWSDGQNVTISFVAAYNANYIVTFAAGLKSADLTVSLTENISYQLKTLRNPAGRRWPFRGSCGPGRRLCATPQ